MRIKLICLSLIYICLSLGCKEERSSAVKDAKVEASVSKQTITKKDIQSLKYTDYGLSNDARVEVSDWQKYQELVNQIDFLKQADFSFYEGEITLVTTFLNDFKAEIPQILATREIQARLVVLETKTLKLNSLLSLDNISKANKLEGIKELLVAFSNLNLQINKKLEFDANDIFKPKPTNNEGN